MKHATKPSILITPGDPQGIGPEITKKALKDPSIKKLARVYVLNNTDKTGFSALKKATELLRQGRAHGLVTAPVNKYKINKSGIPFKGHTEYLAKVANTKKYAMMFCGGPLKISVVTRHVALKDVPRLLTRQKIKDTIVLTEKALRKFFKIKQPRIGVCGLNPHCGEGTLLGGEEKTIISPVLKSLSSSIKNLSGVLPADVAFHLAYKGKLDAVIAMYHDQALAPFKMIAFEKGVNVTLGLPFIRTSVDHGTAYDIAGKGIANPDSMKEAIKLAVMMCKAMF